jgi:transposase
MGADRAVYSARTARRSQTFGRCAGNSQRHFLCADDGLPMAGAAERFAAEEYNAFLFCAVGSGRHAGARPRGALCRCSRSSGPRGQSKRRDHRQPVCESRSKRGSKIDPQGFDAGKKVTGRKRHILVDTLGLLLGVSVLPADIQDRDGTRDLLRRARRRFPFIERIFADAGYQGPKMAATIAATGNWKIEIVKRSDHHRFVVLPKRWIVERTFAWISRNRRLVRDFERYASTVAAFFRLAMIRLMLKRLVRPSH